MNHRRIISVLMFIVCLGLAPAALSANEFDYQILNAGINFGWAEATIDLLGINTGTTPYLSDVLANIIGHLTEAQFQVTGTEWESLQLTSVNPELERFFTYTARWTSDQQAAQIRTLQSRIRSKLSKYHAGGGPASGPTCASHLLLVGYHFGRAHIGALTGNKNYHSSAKGSLINTVSEGLKIAPIISCDFATSAEWSAVPYMEPFSMEVYEDTLYALQVLAWKLNDFTPAPPPPAPPSLPPLPSAPAADLSGRWVRLSNNAILEFRKTASGYTGRILQITNDLKNVGYSNGEVILEINQVSGNMFYGRSKWRYTDGRVTWKDITINMNVNNGMAICREKGELSWLIRKIR